MVVCEGFYELGDGSNIAGVFWVNGFKKYKDQSVVVRISSWLDDLELDILKFV